MHVMLSIKYCGYGFDFDFGMAFLCLIFLLFNNNTLNRFKVVF